jgi:hypothetical protein
MAYIPLNKIVTNLYTNGGEYQSFSGIEYVGFYHKLYTGEIYAGKTLNSNPIKIQLFPLIPSPTSNELVNTTLTPSFINEGPPFPSGFDEEQINIADNQQYMFLQNNELKDIVKSIPSQQYQTPLLEDYKLGVFQRFFCVKVNEDNYLEIDAETFTALRGQDEKWNWELYTPFRISWTLRGNQEEVERTNYNITLLAEKSLKRKGFQRFLRYNYLKFYLPNPTPPSS